MAKTIRSKTELDNTKQNITNILCNNDFFMKLNFSCDT